jgi:CubicO group peptidase (beta-lactamase class C family)
MTAFDRETNVAHRAFVPLSSSVENDRPVLVASFTKLWTAVAALRMIARGELSLDEAVGDVLPELASRPWSDSTVGELMTHTSRVPEFEAQSNYFRRTDVDLSTPVPVLARYIPASWSERRGIYKYRNAEFAIMGAILAARATASAGDVLAREVFTPSRMKSAGLLVGSTVPTGLDLTPMGPVRPQNFFTAGAGYASAADLLSFFEALVGTDLLPETSKALLFRGVKERGNSAIGCWAHPFAAPDGGATRLVERPGTFGNVHLFSAFFPEEARAIVAWTDDGAEISRPHVPGVGASLARTALE